MIKPVNLETSLFTRADVITFTVYDQNKVHALINARPPPFKADFKTFSILDQIEINIFEVNSRLLLTCLLSHSSYVTKY